MSSRNQLTDRQSYAAGGMAHAALLMMMIERERTDGRTDGPLPIRRSRSDRRRLRRKSTERPSGRARERVSERAAAPPVAVGERERSDHRRRNGARPRRRRRQQQQQQVAGGRERGL